MKVKKTATFENDKKSKHKEISIIQSSGVATLTTDNAKYVVSPQIKLNTHGDLLSKVHIDELAKSGKSIEYDDKELLSSIMIANPNITIDELIRIFPLSSRLPKLPNVAKATHKINITHHDENQNVIFLQPITKTKIINGFSFDPKISKVERDQIFKQENTNLVNDVFDATFEAFGNLAANGYMTKEDSKKLVYTLEPKHSNDSTENEEVIVATWTDVDAIQPIVDNDQKIAFMARAVAKSMYASMDIVRQKCINTADKELFAKWLKFKTSIETDMQLKDNDSIAKLSQCDIYSQVNIDIFKAKLTTFMVEHNLETDPDSDFPITQELAKHEFVKSINDLLPITSNENIKRGIEGELQKIVEEQYINEIETPIRVVTTFDEFNKLSFDGNFNLNYYRDINDNVYFALYDSEGANLEYIKVNGELKIDGVTTLNVFLALQENERCFGVVLPSSNMDTVHMTTIQNYNNYKALKTKGVDIESRTAALAMADNLLSTATVINQQVLETEPQHDVEQIETTFDAHSSILSTATFDNSDAEDSFYSVNDEGFFNYNRESTSEYYSETTLLPEQFEPSDLIVQYCDNGYSQYAQNATYFKKYNGSDENNTTLANKIKDFITITNNKFEKNASFKQEMSMLGEFHSNYVIGNKKELAIEDNFANNHNVIMTNHRYYIDKNKFRTFDQYGRVVTYELNRFGSGYTKYVRNLNGNILYNQRYNSQDKTSGLKSSEKQNEIFDLFNRKADLENKIERYVYDNINTLEPLDEAQVDKISKDATSDITLYSTYSHNITTKLNETFSEWQIDLATKIFKKMAFNNLIIDALGKEGSKTDIKKHEAENANLLKKFNKFVMKDGKVVSQEENAKHLATNIADKFLNDEDALNLANDIVSLKEKIDSEKRLNKLKHADSIYQDTFLDSHQKLLDEKVKMFEEKFKTHSGFAEFEESGKYKTDAELNANKERNAVLLSHALVQSKKDQNPEIMVKITTENLNTKNVLKPKGMHKEEIKKVVADNEVACAALEQVKKQLKKEHKAFLANSSDSTSNDYFDETIVDDNAFISKTAHNSTPVKNMEKQVKMDTDF